MTEQDAQDGTSSKLHGILMKCPTEPAEVMRIASDIEKLEEYKELSRIMDSRIFGVCMRNMERIDELESELRIFRISWGVLLAVVICALFVGT